MFDYVGMSFLNNNLNKSSFTDVLSYGKKAVGTTLGYLSSAASYLTPQYAKELFVGKSTEHYANVASYTKDAAVATAYLSADAAKIAYNAAKLGGQIFVGHNAYHNINNNLGDAKYMFKAAAYAAEYVSPDSLPTRLLKHAAHAADVLDKTLDENPMLSQGVLIAGVISMTGTAPLIDTVKGAAKVVVGTLEVARNLGCVALEATAGTILYVKETIEGSPHSEVQVDAQTGFGDSELHNTNIETFGIDLYEKNIYACGEVFSFDDVQVTN